MRLSAIARFAQTLAIQVQNSVGLIESIRVAAPANNNKYIERSLLKIADHIEQGESITQAFQRESLFQGVVQQMISAGEQSGDLADPAGLGGQLFRKPVGPEAGSGHLHG